MLENLNKDVKILNITHKSCMDGLFSSIAVHMFCEQNGYQSPEIHEAQYSADAIVLPDVKGKYVIMTDFCYPKAEMTYINENAEGLLIIDHHKTAKDIVSEFDHVFDNDHSGAVLTWLTLLDEHVPLIFQYVEDRDIWKWRLPNSKAVSAGLKSLTPDQITNLASIGMLFNETYINTIGNVGSIILDYQDKEVANVADKGKKNTVNIGGLDMPCINNAFMISEVGNVMAKNCDSQASCQWFVTADELVFSLRSIGVVDVGVIARSHGGGGHCNAAGFSYKVNDFDWSKLFSSKTI